MIIDLRTSDPRALDADVAVVGAGVAGLLLATKLRARGMRVVLLESGGLQPGEDPDVNNRVVQLGKFHEGSFSGRTRCLGGTSVRWGGKMIPFLPQDVMARPHLGLAAWPVQLPTLLEHLPEVERLFNVEHGPYEELQVSDVERHSHPELVARSEKLPLFKYRSLRRLVGDDLADHDLSTLINATVTSFGISDGSVSHVTATGPGGKTVTVYARQFVIAAGAIESTRILLNLHRETGIFSGCDVLGAYFFDHLAATIGRFESPDCRGLNRFGAHRFLPSNLRGYRLELAPAAQAEDRVGSAYGYIDFERTEETGFQHIRDLLRAVQGKARIGSGLLLNLARSSPYLARALFWRLYHRQMLWPASANVVLNIVAEQIPIRESKITLAMERDSRGVPLAAVDWRICARDRETFRAYARRFGSHWRHCGLEVLGTIAWDSFLANDARLDDAISDFYHPGGSTRMGEDRRSAVVNENLRTFALSNLWIASTSVFPAGASANPTLMLMLLANRLAGKLLAEQQRSPPARAAA